MAARELAASAALAARTTDSSVQDNASTKEGSHSTSVRTLYWLQGAYLTILCTAFVARGISIKPDILFLLLAIGFAWRGNRWPFIRDFGPFVLLLLSYDAMRGFADDLGGAVHVTYPIAIDKALFFGHVPTVVLQDWLFDPNSPHWYDYGSALLHIMHFIVPLFFAAIIWQHHRQHYWPFVISLLVLSYAGFVTFMLLPTAPPWWASLKGELAGVSVVHEGLPAFRGIYSALSPNPVAAMPSLHAAYPCLFLLFGLRIWGWRATPLAIYPAAVFFAVIYLGHHYVADLLGGIVYATGAYVIVCSPAAARLADAGRSLSSRLRGRKAAQADVGIVEASAVEPPDDPRRREAA